MKCSHPRYLLWITFEFCTSRPVIGRLPEKYPIISLLTVKEAINTATSIKEIYDFCQKSEKKYAGVPLVKKNVIREYAKIKFKITKRVFDPVFEKKANKAIYEQVVKSIDAGVALKRVRYKELSLNDVVNEDNNLWKS